MYEKASPQVRQEHIEMADKVANEVNNRFEPSQRVEFLHWLKKTIIGTIHLQIEDGQSRIAELKEIAAQLEKI